jgi:hypothetical protein
MSFVVDQDPYWNRIQLLVPDPYRYLNQSGSTTLLTFAVLSCHT